MKQQINLYQPIFRKEKIIFSAHAMLISCAFLIVGLGLISVWSYWNVSSLEQQLATLSVQQQQNMEGLEKLSAAIPKKTIDPSLEDEIKLLTASIVAKQSILTKLSNTSFGNQSGFSSHMTGLARQKIEGLWLTDIQINAGGDTLMLKGGSSKPELIPRYLIQLRGEAVFDGKGFEQFELKRSETAGLIDFLIKTETDDQSS